MEKDIHCLGIIGTSKDDIEKKIIQYWGGIEQNDQR